MEKNSNRQQCDKCGHMLKNKTRLFAKCPNCKAVAPFRWIESEALRVTIKNGTVKFVKI